MTGATAGIGRAVAVRLAEHGAEVVVHGRDAHRGGEVVSAIAERGGRARFVAADLSSAEEVERLAAEAGEVDILVNNAGVYELVSTPSTSASSFDRHVAINTRAPFQLVKALTPGMIQRGHGVIVNVSSTGATMVAPVGAAYGASKAALESLTRYWATEFGAAGIRVNGVRSGPVRTEGTAPLLSANAEAMDRTVARGRIGDPEEIADVVLFLAGEGSSYVNGSVVAVHGGERSLLPG
ncbi:NAD(P)-dependent dehydrogenase (short-subunit alcohol dehydrogenase family) [Catenuloplanes atrovinosus]|uniref:NAD(P)-dependent dehydrogenase (Short-subunit alcohol dehydrogenase family) n=1 Tax=Catenuloplanes atrovinosus TaxID=137266 RepID=A0AAE4CA52_9ACTN|nr:NAD(P)-dependent dehydrogenase (short-subunit alcohol dehydrogenase family) [Catenuloplanes atrovinosus]